MKVSYMRWMIQSFCILWTLAFTSAADPVLESVASPDAVGNTVDSNSVINWVEVPQGDPYKASADYDDGGMGPLFDFARSFINTCFPNGFPYDLIERIQAGNFDFGSEIQKIVQDYIGYMVAVAIGILFVIIFPIIGCCFCCCRLCGNCGGKRMQKHNPSASCKRKVFGIILLLLTVMAIVGSVCVLVSNERMSTALNKFGSTAVDNIDDVNTFLDNTIVQVKHVAENNFDFTKKVLFRDLDSLGYLVGIPVRASLGATGGVDNAFASALTLPGILDSAVADTDTVLNQVQTLKTNVATLTADLAAVKNRIDNACSGPCTGAPSTTGLTVGFDDTVLPDLSTQKTQLDNLKSNNLTKTILDAKVDYDTIPEKVQNDTTTTVTNLKNQVNDYSKQVDPMINMTNNLKTQALGSINFNDLKSTIKDYTKLVSDYDKYRWYAGIGLSTILLLIGVLLFLGLACGVFGGSASDVPTERGGLSNCGGIMLMAAVGFIFIFSWLFMLLTTLTFMIGAPVERYVCQPLTNPELTIFTKLIDDMGLIGGGDGSFLGNMLFQDPNIDLTIAGILKDCRDGKTAYTAFKMNNFKQFNLTEMTDYKSKLDIDGQLDAINVDLSTVKILSSDIETQLNDFTTTVQSLNFSDFDELSKDTVNTDLTTMAADLRTAAQSPSLSAPEKADLNGAADDLDAIQAGSMANTNTAKANLIVSSNNLETTFTSIPTNLNSVVDILNSTEIFIHTNGSSLVKAEATNFATRLTGVVDSFIADALYALQNEIGSCTPVYNVYASLLLNGFCRYTLDAFNAFWFSLGWAIFFLVPSVIFAVKLAKHYRKMNMLDSFDPNGPSFDDPLRGKKNFGPGVGPISTSGGPIFGNNKVGHADRW